MERNSLSFPRVVKLKMENKKRYIMKRKDFLKLSCLGITSFAEENKINKNNLSEEAKEWINRNKCTRDGVIYWKSSWY